MAVQRRALAAGVVERSPVKEDRHDTSGPLPIQHMPQGAVVEPFGQLWLIGKVRG